MLGGCSQNAPQGGDSKTSTKTDTATATHTDTAGLKGAEQSSKPEGNAPGTATGTSTGTGEKTAGIQSATSTSGASSTIPATAGTTPATAGTGPAGSPQAGAKPGAQPGKVNISLLDLPDDIPICTVAGTDIKVAEYKRMLRIQEIQTNQAIATDPMTRARFLQEAQRLNVTLTPDEKTRLVQAARQQKKDPKEFQEFLKQSNATEQQFNDEVLATGLAFKTSNMLIEQSLLNDLVNRALMAQAAQESGGEKEALNKYLAFKRTPQYDMLLKQTGLSADSLKEEMVRAELAKTILGKIENQTKVSDAEVRKVYEANKKALKHDERIRLSTILIACPEKTMGPILGVRDQVAKAHPKLSGKDLDDEVLKTTKGAEQKALICMGQAKGGADFAKLANENSADPMTHAKKNGGDVGFVEKKNLIPNLANVLWELKPGQVLPQVVKNELGFSVYKVTGREPAGPVNYEDVKPRLEVMARQSKLQQSLAQWLTNRRKIVRIEFTPKFLAIANGAKPAGSK